MQLWTRCVRRWNALDAFRFTYQLIVVGGCEVGMSIGEQEQLAVGVDGEETQEVLNPASYKVCHGLGLGLRQGLGTAVDVGAAVRWHPDSWKTVDFVTAQSQLWNHQDDKHCFQSTAALSTKIMDKFSLLFASPGKLLQKKGPLCSFASLLNCHCFMWFYCNVFKETWILAAIMFMKQSEKKTHCPSWHQSCGWDLCRNSCKVLVTCSSSTADSERVGVISDFSPLSTHLVNKNRKWGLWMAA